MAATRQSVFISHIHEEAALGDAVKAIIEDVFGSHGVHAFLSSDMGDLPPGRRWLDEITRQLDEARVIVSLISPVSLTRPWVNIELGAGWIKGLRVIPLCHSGQRVSDLPRPFQDFTGIGLDQDDVPKRLLAGIADGFDIAHPTRLAFVDMLKELRHVAAEIKAPPAPPAPPRRHEPELHPDQLKILLVVAEMADSGAPELPLTDLPVMAGVKPSAFTHHIDALKDRRFVYIDYYASGEHTVRLLPAGSKWLLDHDQIPDRPSP
jgi:TIR domain-containing protein